jgi:hypothetical protein
MDYFNESDRDEVDGLNRHERRTLKKLRRNAAIREILAAGLPADVRADAVKARSALPRYTGARYVGRLRGAEK